MNATLLKAIKPILAMIITETCTVKTFEIFDQTISDNVQDWHLRTYARNVFSHKIIPRINTARFLNVILQYSPPEDGLWKFPYTTRDPILRGL